MKWGPKHPASAPMPACRQECALEKFSRTAEGFVFILFKKKTLVQTCLAIIHCPSSKLIILSCQASNGPIKWTRCNNGDNPLGDGTVFSHELINTFTEHPLCKQPNGDLLVKILLITREYKIEIPFVKFTF